METENRQISVGMYRSTDIMVLTFIACALEYLNVFVFKNFFPGELYTLSIMLPVTLIIMHRWGVWALIPAMLTGLSYCIANKAANPASYIVYTVGNGAVLLNMLWYRFVPKKKIEKSVVMQIAYTASGYLAVALGRAVMTVIFEGDFFGNLKNYIIADEISGVIGMIIVFIAARQKDLFKDQMEYLRELAASREKNSLKEDKVHE